MKKRLITKKQSREREDKQVSYSSIEQANHIGRLITKKLSKKSKDTKDFYQSTY